jgi:hypothetical protein
MLNRVGLILLSLFAWVAVADAKGEERRGEMKRLVEAYFSFVDTAEFKKLGFASKKFGWWNDAISSIEKDNDFTRGLLIECGVTPVELYLVAADLIGKVPGASAERRRHEVEDGFRRCFNLGGGLSNAPAPTGDLTAMKIACGRTQAKLVPPFPEVPMTPTDEQRAQAQAAINRHNVEEARLYEICITPVESKSLAEANWEIPWAEEICGGRRHKSWKALFEATGNAHLDLYLDAERSYRTANVPRVPNLARAKNSGDARRFCERIANKYGPKGTSWPGLFKP